MITGILKITKESIFSGLNNISTFTILNKPFQDKFGLLESEVQILLEEYGLVDQLPNIRKWYNGYRIGSCEGIYNPWSVLKCIAANGELMPYWVNTSDNSLMKKLITQGSHDLKEVVELLLKGNDVEVSIDEGIVFTELENNPNAIWTLLLFSGYIALAETPSYGRACQIKIPNMEVIELYKSMILEMVLKQIDDKHYQQELVDRGISRILHIALAFQGKRVLIGSQQK